MAIDRDKVIDAALELLQRDGLETLSLRRLGAELGVSAPTIYWHVDNKRELLDLMAARLIARSTARGLLDPMPGEAWWEWLERRIRGLYETLIAHRDAPLLLAGNRPTVDALPSIETALSFLVDQGFEPAAAIETILTFNAFAIGCAVEWQAEESRGLATHDGALASIVRSGAFPTIVAAFAQHQRAHQVNINSRLFEHGLPLMIAGLRARIEAAASAGV